MGGAILAGLMKSGFDPANISVSTKTAASAEKHIDELGVHAFALENGADANAMAVAGADVVLVGVKPAYVTEVLAEIADAINDNALVISVAAGVTTASMEAVLPEDVGVSPREASRSLLAAQPSKILRHASFGASGMAWSDIQAIASNPFVKLVAVADVDLNKVADVKAMFPDVRVYQDWRQLLDREQGNLDSCNVSVPDHMHAPIAYSAMQLGKHVYCQKPLDRKSVV